jgi:hypothetical protein
LNKIIAIVILVNQVTIIMKGIIATNVARSVKPAHHNIIIALVVLRIESNFQTKYKKLNIHLKYIYYKILYFY